MRSRGGDPAYETVGSLLLFSQAKDNKVLPSRTTPPRDHHSPDHRSPARRGETRFSSPRPCANAFAHVTASGPLWSAPFRRETRPAQAIPPHQRQGRSLKWASARNSTPSVYETTTNAYVPEDRLALLYACCRL